VRCVVPLKRRRHTSSSNTLLLRASGRHCSLNCQKGSALLCWMCFHAQPMFPTITSKLWCSFAAGDYGNAGMVLSSRGEHLSKRQLLMECKIDASLWRCRMKTTEVSVCDDWCNLFATAM
jgi:hypothetical protein